MPKLVNWENMAVTEASGPTPWYTSCLYREKVKLTGSSRPAELLRNVYTPPPVYQSALALRSVVGTTMLTGACQVSMLAGWPS